MKTFTIKTFGCKVNQYESQAIREDMLSRGFRELSNGDKPSVCIVNTCCVTGNADRKSRHFVNRMRNIHPDAEIIVMGCGVDYKPGDFKKADLLIPNTEKTQVGISRFSGHTRAFVKIQDGCDQFCSYCIVPYVRGRSRSRDFGEVLDEVKRLVSGGYREIILTGIHLGEYDRLIELIIELEKVDKLLRVRLSSIEPQEIKPEIVDAVRKSYKICRHMHIPIQSGSDKILKGMNRRYFFAEYKKLTEDIRQKMPDIIFTTDIIVGFPGETEEDFLLSCNAVREIGFAKVHIFPYSDRAGTKAFEFSDKVCREEVKRRVKEIQAVEKETAWKIRGKLINTVQKVLVENRGKGISGYTSGYMPVSIKNRVDTNNLIKVKITGQNSNCLIGKK